MLWWKPSKNHIFLIFKAIFMSQKIWRIYLNNIKLGKQLFEKVIVWNSYQEVWLIFDHCTEVILTSFPSGGFTIATIVNAPDRKLVKSLSVQRPRLQWVTWNSNLELTLEHRYCSHLCSSSLPLLPSVTELVITTSYDITALDKFDLNKLWRKLPLGICTLLNSSSNGNFATSSLLGQCNQSDDLFGEIKMF